MTIKAITTADLQQLAAGITPAYLQLLQELVNRLLFALDKCKELSEC